MNEEFDSEKMRKKFLGDSKIETQEFSNLVMNEKSSKISQSSDYGL